MHSTLALSFLLAVIAVAACSGGDPPTAARDAGKESLCDGNSALRLRVFVAPQNEREIRGSIVRVENGFPSFAVDGHCEYWLGGGWTEDPNARNLGWRHGKLDSALAEAMQQAFPLSQLSSLQDCASTEGLFDAPLLVIASGSSSAACVRGGPRYQKAWSLISTHAPALWEAGEPLDQGMWISASSADAKLMTYSWPLAEPLRDYVVREDVPEGEYLGFKSGVATLISAPNAVQKLRALREQFLVDSAAATGWFSNTPSVREGELEAQLYMRDAVPYEDEHGLLSFGSSHR